MREKATSNAEWPKGTCDFSGNITTDHHETEAHARAVCDALEQRGFGGEGSVFPVRTWVEVLAMTEPQNDGRNWCEPHRWAIMPARPLCFGRGDSDFHGPLPCIECAHCYEDEMGYLSGDCVEGQMPWYRCSWEHEEYSKQLRQALLRVYARENHALRKLVRECMATSEATLGFACDVQNRTVELYHELRKIDESIYADKDA